MLSFEKYKENYLTWWPKEKDNKIKEHYETYKHDIMIKNADTLKKLFGGD